METAEIDRDLEAQNSRGSSLSIISASGIPQWLGSEVDVLLLLSIHIERASCHAQPASLDSLLTSTYGCCLSRLNTSMMLGNQTKGIGKAKGISLQNFPWE